MNYIKKYLLFILLTGAFIGCGHTEVEEDEHSDVPIFPKHTNVDVKFEKLDYTYCSSILEVNNRLYMKCSVSEDKGAFIQRLLVLDKNFKELQRLKVLPTTNYLYINKDGNVYTQAQDKNVSYLLKVNKSKSNNITQYKELKFSTKAKANKNLVLVDVTNTTNKDSKNSFDIEYSQQGYQYFKLNVNNKETIFKYKAMSINTSYVQVMAYKGSDKNSMILKIGPELYRVF